MAEVELRAHVTADITEFAEEMEAAVAIAQATAGNLAEAFAVVARDDSLKNLSATVAAGAASATSGFSEVGKAAAAASRESADGVASALAPLTDAGARMFSAWIRGGHDMRREFASIVQSMLTDLAKSGLQDLIFGAKAASPLSGILGQRGKGGGLSGAAASASDGSALQQRCISIDCRIAEQSLQQYSVQRSGQCGRGHRRRSRFGDKWRRERCRASIGVNGEHRRARSPDRRAYRGDGCRGAVGDSDGD